jgi:hypothetical protein
MEVNEEMEREVSGEPERIVLNMKPKAKRSPGQLEALKKAQTVRREKIMLRAQTVEAPEATPTPIEVKPGKDYRQAYKEQKVELNILRFEKALHDRLILETQNSAPPAAVAVPEIVPAVSAKPRDLGPGWIIGAPVRKKNLHY